MENLIEIIETFLQYSDEKLEELSQKNQALRQEREEEHS
ncbi:recombinase [Streptococcus suis]|nr:recombinase [Streptococcus suis]